MTYSLWSFFSILKVEIFKYLYSMILLACLVELFDEIFNFPTLNLCNLLLELVLQLFQDFALPETLTDATNSTYVFWILLGCYQIELVFLLTLCFEMLLIFKSLKNILKTDLRRRWRLRTLWLVSERFHLFEILIELETSSVNLSAVIRRIAPKLFLQFFYEVNKSGFFIPFENRLVFNFTSHRFEKRMLHPLSNIDNRFFSRERS